MCHSKGCQCGKALIGTSTYSNAKKSQRSVVGFTLQMNRWANESMDKWTKQGVRTRRPHKGLNGDANEGANKA
jgi:hypothetical protein